MRYEQQRRTCLHRRRRRARMRLACLWSISCTIPSQGGKQLWNIKLHATAVDSMSAELLLMDILYFHIGSVFCIDLGLSSGLPLPPDIRPSPSGYGVV